VASDSHTSWNQDAAWEKRSKGRLRRYRAPLPLPKTPERRPFLRAENVLGIAECDFSYLDFLSVITVTLAGRKVTLIFPASTLALVSTGLMASGLVSSFFI